MIPSNQSRYYGYPDWLSASTIVTLLSRALQYKSDFYINRGVLAYILSIIGQVDSAVWDQIQAKVQGSVGGGNNFRNLAINLPNENAVVKVDKLAASDKEENQFAKDSETFAQHIVSAHRVPPVLANILISGKLGAANETVQALIAFQLLVVGPLQNMVQRVLASTLGGDDGVTGLKAEDFRLRKITSQFNIQGLDTASRMREESAGSGRDVSEGLKD
jgi:capsid portal protein